MKLEIIQYAWKNTEDSYIIIYLPVVPHKAEAEASKIENL